MNKYWRNSNNNAFPWVKTLDKIMQEIKLPEFNGPLVYLASDSSGYEKTSDYLATSFVVIDLFNSNEWEAKRRYIRHTLLPNNRRMSFKTLNDSHRRNALIPFLDAANYIDGLLINFMLNKKIKCLVTYEGVFDKWKNILGLKWKWSEKQFKKMFEIAHFASILIGALGKDNQEIYWISDQDEIFANPIKHQDVSTILSGLGNIYIQHSPGKLGVGTSEIDPGDRAEEDLIAIVDLAAGALVDFVNNCSNNPNWKTNSGMIMIENNKVKSDYITSWLSKTDSRLKKVNIVFDESEISDFSIRKFDIRESQIII